MRAQESSERPPIGSFFVFLGAGALYLLTLNPAFPNDDSPETLTAAATLGVGHPPGYPLALIFINAFRWLPWGGDGFRASLASAFLAALSAGLFTWFLARLHEKSPSSRPALFSVLWAPAFGLLLAFSTTYWRNALAAKGAVYHLQILLLLFLSFSLFLTEGRRRWFFAGLSLGLGFLNHWPVQAVVLAGLLPIPVLFKRRPRLADLAHLPSGLTGLVLGCAPLLLYAPLRETFHPALDWGVVTSLGRWLEYVGLRNYAWLHAPLSGAQTWRLFLDRSREIASFILQEPFPLFILAVLPAWWWLARRGRGLLAATLAFPILALVAANLFINRLPAPNPWPLRNHLMAALPFLLAGVALSSPWNALPKLKFPWGIAALAAALALGLFSFSERNQSRDTLAWRYGLDLLSSCPRNTVLFAEEDSDFFTAGYFQAIEGKRPDLDVVTTFLWQEEWGVARWKRAHGDWNLETHPGAAPWERAGDNIRRAIGALKGKRPLRISFFPRFVKVHALTEPTPWKATPYGLTSALEPKSSPAPQAPRLLLERLHCGAVRGTGGKNLPYQIHLIALYGQALHFNSP
jgi:hypothetical protein